MSPPLLLISPPLPSSTASPPLTIPLSFPSPSHLLLFSLSFNTRKPVTMAPWSNCRSISLTSGIESCLCVGVMHHSQRPLFCRPTWRFTGSYHAAQLSPIFFFLLHPLTPLTCSIKQGIVAVVELFFNNEIVS